MCACVEGITDVCMWRRSLMGRSLMCACMEGITDVCMYGGDH